MTKLTDTRRNYKCGCVATKEENVWVVTEPCDTHKPNFQKKTEKLMHRLEVKRKRDKYLKHEKRR